MKHPRSGASGPRSTPPHAAARQSSRTTSPGVPLVVTDLGEPGPGAGLVDHLGAVLVELADATAAAASGPGAPVDPRGGDDLTDLDCRADLCDLFEAQAASRWLDVAAARMRAAGAAVELPVPAGHELGACAALATRPEDPALPEHPSTAFFLARSAAAGLDTGILDVAYRLAGRADGPTGTGGWERTRAELAIFPEPATTAGHLPRALGLAWALGRRQRPDAGRRWSADAVTVALFGDDAADHSTLTGAVDAACWAACQGVPLPLLLVCHEDGAGPIPSPRGWIRAAFGCREGLRYLFADGATDPLGVLATTREAVDAVRSHRRPVLLHLAGVRIGRDGDGHPGGRHRDHRPDVADRSVDAARDPLVATMRAMVRTGSMTGHEVGDRLLEVRDRVASAVEEALGRPRPAAGAHRGPAGGNRAPAVAVLAARTPPADARSKAFGDPLPEEEGPLSLARSVNRALLDAAVTSGEVLLLGAGIGRAGGEHGVTHGLLSGLGPSRVVDTLPDEQTLLGLALGAAVAGAVPVAEIPLPGLVATSPKPRLEAATLHGRSAGMVRNPVVVRAPLRARDQADAVAALRGVPGLLVVCAAHPSEAPGLLRTCLAAATADGAVCVLLEPVELYAEPDMLEDGDGAWLAPYPAPALWGSLHAPVGRASVWGSGADLTIATFGTGLRTSMRVAAALEREGTGARVVDLRWLAPLPMDDVVREAGATGRLLIADGSFAVSAELIAGVLEAGYDGRVARIAADPAPCSTEPDPITETLVMDASRRLLAD